MEDRVTKETKLNVTKDIVASYIKGDNNKISPDELCGLIKKVFSAIEDVVPEPERRKVGLG